MTVARLSLVNAPRKSAVARACRDVRGPASSGRDSISTYQQPHIEQRHIKAPRHNNEEHTGTLDQIDGDIGDSTTHRASCTMNVSFPPILSWSQPRNTAHTSANNPPFF
jgi:hypothetical protein